MKKIIIFEDKVCKTHVLLGNAKTFSSKKRDLFWTQAAATPRLNPTKISHLSLLLFWCSFSLEKVPRLRALAWVSLIWSIFKLSLASIIMKKFDLKIIKYIASVQILFGLGIISHNILLINLIGRLEDLQIAGLLNGVVVIILALFYVLAVRKN